jgi:hypothetical protein
MERVDRVLSRIYSLIVVNIIAQARTDQDVEEREAERRLEIGDWRVALRLTRLLASR